jgi:PTS system mannose-specific IIB component/fructoselysine and glucoselysine-specific PTS system IIB component
VALDHFRIDDRLIHGQVVVGWGQPCALTFLVLVDDAVVESDWEQELYRMGVPPEMTLHFASVEGAAERLGEFRAMPGAGMLLTGEIQTMQRLVGLAPGNTRVTIGGVHHRDGRMPRLRYVFLAPEEEAQLRALKAAGVHVVAQDVPSAVPIPLDEVLRGDGTR